MNCRSANCKPIGKKLPIWAYDWVMEEHDRTMKRYLVAEDTSLIAARLIEAGYQAVVESGFYIRTNASASAIAKLIKR